MEHSPSGTVFRLMACVLLLVACILFVFGNSMQSSADSSARSVRFAQAVLRVLGRLFTITADFSTFLVRNIRKIAHLLEYALLGAICVVCLFVMDRVGVHMVLHSAFLVLAVAVMDETIQRYTGRGSSVLDVTLDFAGGMGGIALSLLILGLIRALWRRLIRKGQRG